MRANRKGRASGFIQINMHALLFVLRRSHKICVRDVSQSSSARWRFIRWLCTAIVHVNMYTNQRIFCPYIIIEWGKEEQKKKLCIIEVVQCDAKLTTSRIRRMHLSLTFVDCAVSMCNGSVYTYMQRYGVWHQQ